MCVLPGSQGKKVSKEEVVTHCEAEDRDKGFHNKESLVPLGGSLPWLELMRENRRSNIEAVSMNHPSNRYC